MSDFLTVEDINSTLLKYGDVPTLHSIDTSKIGTDAFEDVMYDFCIVNHTVSGSNHTFTFEVRNSLWCGGYYFTKANGDYLDIDGSYSSDVITVTTTESSIILVVYLTNLYSEFSFNRLTWISNDLKNISRLYNADETQSFSITMLDGSTASGTVSFIFDEYTASSTISDGSVDYQLESSGVYFDGIVSIVYDGCTYYIRPNFIKNVVPIIIDDTLIASKVNTVTLNIPDEFTGLSTGTVYYNDEEIEVDFTNDTFELDLTGKEDTKNVKFQLMVDETSTVMNHTYDFSVPCTFVTVGSYQDLYVELNGSGGSRIIELSADISLSDTITVNHDVQIVGNDYSFNLNGHSFNLNEGVTFKVNNAVFNVGNPAVIQGLNTKFEADNCTFSECSATDYNNNGSVILCDIDLDSLSVDDDFTTILSGCSFVNNHSCILHGGELSVTNCTYHNTDTDYVDKNNVAFLYQVDGEAIIRDSIFDIDYSNDDSLCTNQMNIGFGQALFKCGSEAQINTASHDYLSNDEKALFCDAPYNNICHLFAKYYYPKLESCVYSSPLEDMEEKALCYSVSGTNWVFKNNVQVTRADAGTENSTNHINWEE